MIYKLHIATNSNSILNTFGWISILGGIAMFFATSGPSPIIFLLIGGSIIWLTSKKKIFKVDTEARELQLDETSTYSSPEKIFISLNRESQVVNSRVQTTTVYTEYYTAYFVADGENYMISKNKKLETDFAELSNLAKELKIELEEKY